MTEGHPYRKWTLAWSLAALAAGLVYVVLVRHGFPPQSDVWDYAQEARQLARGQGFTSLYTYPVHLGSGPPFPVEWRMPGYAGIGWALLSLGVPLPLGFLLVGALAHAALVGLVFLLTTRLSSPVGGCIAAAGAIACPLLLDTYNPGMSQLPAAMLGLLTWYLLLQGKGMRTSLAAGIAAGAAWYLRAESALMLPLWIAAALYSRSSQGDKKDAGIAGGAIAWKLAAVFLVSYCAIILPWLVVGQMHGNATPIRGNPLLLYTPQFPGYSSARSIGANLPGVFQYIASHPLTFWVRYAKDGVGYVLDLLTGLGPAMVGLGIAGLLLRYSDGNHSRVEPMAPSSRLPAILLSLGIILQIGVLSALERSPRFLVPIVPIACILIGLLSSEFCERLRPQRVLVALLIALVLERAATVLFQRADAARRFAPLPRELVAAVEAEAEEWPRDALVLTDVPDWVAWHFDRPAVLLPMWRDLLTVVESRKVSAILLTHDARGRNASDGDWDWVRTIDSSGPIEGFSGPEMLPGGSRVYVRGRGQSPP